MAEGGSKKGRVSLNLTLTLSNVIFLSVYGVCVCVCVFCSITRFLSVYICVSLGGLSFIASDQYMCDF